MKAVFAVAALSVSILAFSQDTDCNSVERCQAAVKANRRNSLPHFRLGELFFAENQYVSSANEFRESLNGDLKPKWIEVWAHLNLGKIVDTTGQRERALNEYRLAKRTGDNTRGALDEAARYEREPYRYPPN